MVVVPPRSVVLLSPATGVQGSDGGQNRAPPPPIYTWFAGAQPSPPHHSNLVGPALCYLVDSWQVALL